MFAENEIKQTWLWTRRKGEFVNKIIRTRMEIEFYSQPTVGQVPLLIFAYLGLSLFISGFIMTILAYAPADSYLMNMVQNMGIMNFIGPIVLIIGSESFLLLERIYLMIFLHRYYVTGGYFLLHDRNQAKDSRL